MSIVRKIVLAAAPIALIALGGCTTGLTSNVTRFQQMPTPQGQSFAVVARDPALQGSLEFAQYARLVEARLADQGYVRAESPASASLLVKLDYGVDKGREKIRSSPFAYGAGWNRDPFFWGPYRRWGRGGFIYGFHDPFLFGGYGYNDVESYTVFTADLDMVIERRTGERVFEGEAKAQSRSDDLTYLVPNLVEAMFTGFPGNSGETMRITVPPPPKG
ncbi:DUF4136 domain-containing protein [Sphingomonas colocasiae]|uniref:DUF4136 domain-containing protein n=1 Tax=Sphingomonas colocasiae TaxID=1848973 RepID=A0ABS7PNH3_9SPHN|nr:DUF4136 domain-containing protein [Sphingomonas colocasiae]MBY8822863.1 DUF4136 domain-containing protein [Sphingomonas colocasiae]